MEEKLTLLTEGQIWGTDKEEKLDIFKKYGSECEITDLAIITGATVCDYENKGNHLANIHGFYWTQTITEQGEIIGGYGYDDKKVLINPFEGRAVIRPVLQIPDSLKDKIETDEIELGEYPQTIADKNTTTILEMLCYGNFLAVGGKSYMLNDEKYNFSQCLDYPTYQYEGKKYVRVILNSMKKQRLSDGEYYQPKQFVWVEVSPVKWLVDKKSGLLISKKGLVSGVRFNRLLPDKFKDTDIKEYLEENMFEDLFSGLDFEIEEKGFQKTLK